MIRGVPGAGEWRAGAGAIVFIQSNSPIRFGAPSLQIVQNRKRYIKNKSVNVTVTEIGQKSPKKRVNPNSDMHDNTFSARRRNFDPGIDYS